MRLPTLPIDPSGVHGAFVALGTLAAVAVFLVEARRRRTLDDRLFIILTGSLFCGGVAAKLSTSWRYLAAAPDPTLVGAPVYGGKSVLGGLAGAYLGAIVTKRLIGYRAPTGDVFAPAVALGIGIGRFGCLLTETPGTPTGLPWGVRVDAARAARHPGFPRGLDRSAAPSRRSSTRSSSTSRCSPCCCACAAGPISRGSCSRSTCSPTPSSAS